MTMKYKIILGFVSTMAIMAALAVLGYRSLHYSLEGLTEYRRNARINVQLSDAVSQLTAASSGAMMFLSSRDARVMEGAMASLDTMDALLTKTEQEITRKENRDIIATIHANGRAYREGLAKDLGIVKTAQAVYENQVLPNSLVLENVLFALSDAAVKVNNVELQDTLTHILVCYARMRAALSRLDVSRSPDDFVVVEENIKAIKPYLDQARAAIITQEGLRLHSEMMDAFTAIFNAADAMGAAARASADNVITNRAVRMALTQELSGLSAKFDSQMHELGRDTTAKIDYNQTLLLGVSAAGVLIGMVLATFIIMSLVRVLHDLASCAGAVARGDFTYTVKSREKGEIGTMVASMREIPVVLEHLLNEVRLLADNILSGKLRTRLDVSMFPGSFSELTRSVNTVSDAFTTRIDDLALPIMCCDTERRIVFLNRQAQSVIGGDATGRPCAEELKADCCGAGCLGTRAMERQAIVSSETTIHPHGQTMHVTVSATPLYNPKKEVVGFTEVLTDLSEIKSKQDLILRVAGEASVISNRIAAASEELSAQVEEVSRGADVQRDRVSATAGAIAEMNSTVIEVARSAGEASEQSENTRQKAQHGADLVNQVMAAISTIDAVGLSLHTNMQELGNQAESIGNVMNVISDIADQTNLLALNAAIEAARAGEAGRGFAVVADEVRKLAEKTMQATHEVGSSINAIQHSAHINITEVGKAVASVTEANKLAISSGEALGEIVNMASSNSAVVASIATAAEEQSATTEEISHAAEEINRIVSETAEGMVQSSAAVQELSHMAQELRRVMEGLR